LLLKAIRLPSGDHVGSKSDGTFVKEQFIEKRTLGDGSAWDIAFSKDPQQKYMYLADGSNEKIHILQRDTLEEIDGQPLRAPEDLIVALQSSRKEAAKIRVYRLEWVAVLEVPRGRLLPGATPEERLGIQRWTHGRDWRATGFYNHWTTYAESLQLIASLALGLLVALPRKWSRNGLLLSIAIAGMGVALLLSVTRASWLSLLVSATLITALTLSRRALLIVGACALPLVLAGLFVLHQKRNVGFFDSKDDSIRWRQTVQREGFQLLVSKPRQTERAHCTYPLNHGYARIPANLSSQASAYSTTTFISPSPTPITSVEH